MRDRGGCWTVLLAAAELAELRTGRRPKVALDTAHVAAAVRSEALLRDPAGSSARGFAPLSRLWPTADGWVRTHANYPWQEHRAALLKAFGLPERADAEIAVSLAAALAAQPSQQTEARYMQRARSGGRGSHSTRVVRSARRGARP